MSLTSLKMLASLAGPRLAGSPEKLSALKTLIDEHPTLTALRDSSEKTEIQFDTMMKSKSTRNIEIPDNFDGRSIWKGLLTPVRNQGHCGSCWAFASTGVLADRFNIQSLGQMYVELSPTKLILCDFGGKELENRHSNVAQTAVSDANVIGLKQGSCGGNSLFDAWRYLYLLGTNTEQCIPYDKILGDNLRFDSISTFSKNERLPMCQNVSGPLGDMCQNVSEDIFSGEEHGDPARFYRCAHFYAIAGTEKDGGNEREIRQNIFMWGPVTTGIVVYPDFYLFDAKNDIYEWNGEGEPISGHALEIVGWGEEKGKKYWIIKNSWGTNWGRDGFFYMARGVNNCKIEENIVAGVPDFFYPVGYNGFSLDVSKWGESTELQDKRMDINMSLTIEGGGIDPTTGYSRRAMITKPWIDVQRPIPLSDLPDWKTFVAGISASKENRIKFIREIKEKYPKKSYSILPAILAFGSVLVLIILLYILIRRE